MNNFRRDGQGCPHLSRAGRYCGEAGTAASPSPGGAAVSLFKTATGILDAWRAGRISTLPHP
jgi:hypothetical protein